MATVLKAQATLKRTTQVPEDDVVNTFHFICPSTTPLSSELNAAVNAVQAFYTSVVGSLSGLIDSTGHRIKVYNLNDPLPRTPLRDVALTCAPTGSSLPAEVALCLSYRGDLVSGTNPARLRGRVYVGPLDATFAATTVGGDIRPSTGAMSSMINAGAALASSLAGGSSGVQWCVWSTAGIAAPGGTATPVKFLWCDNAFDTQRRRGAASTTRETFTLP